MQSINAAVVDNDSFVMNQVEAQLMQPKKSGPKFVLGVGNFEKLGMPQLRQISLGMQGDNRDYLLFCHDRVIMAKLDGQVLGLKSHDEEIRNACFKARKFLNATNPEDVTWVNQGYLCNAVGDYYGYIDLNVEDGTTNAKFVLGSGTFERRGFADLHQVSFLAGDERDYLFMKDNRLVMIKLNGEVFGLKSNDERIQDACFECRKFLNATGTEDVQWLAQGELCNKVGLHFDYSDLGEDDLDD